MFAKYIGKQMLLKNNYRMFSASWLKQTMQSSSKTVAVLVHQSEIKDGSLDKVVLPEGLSSSDDFRKDLNMSNAYWFYNN